MNLEGIMLSEIRQKTNTAWYHLCVEYNIQQTTEYKKGIESLI